MRRILLPLLVLLLVAAVAYTGYWFYLAQRLNGEIGPWADARRAQGYELAWQSASVEGFPLAFRMHFTAAALHANRPFAYDVSAPDLIASAAPWNLSRWHWEAPKGAQIDAPGALAAIHAATAKGIVTDDGAAGTIVAFEAHALSGQGVAQGTTAESLAATLTLPRQPAADHRDTALVLTVALDKLVLSVTVPSLGPRIDTLTVAAAVKGALPSGPLAPALAAWSAGGGTIEIENARLLWGPMEATVTGTLALDSRLQPTGALTATIQRPDAIVDAAVVSGSLQQRFAALAKTVLTVLEKPGADGQPVVTAPVSLQDQQLFLGPAKIATLPAIVWE